MHRRPQFLPDGRHFLFTYLTGSPEAAGIYVGDLDGSPPVRVLDGSDRSDHALFAPSSTPGEPGHLLFRRQRLLMALPFDAERRRVVGEMFPLVERVGGSGNTGHGAFSVSQGGVLAHADYPAQTDELVWLDRSGRRLATVAEQLSIVGFSLSPDEQTLAFATGELATDIWIRPLAGGAPSRFTFGPDPGWDFPVWSPNGSQLVYATPGLAGLLRYEIKRRRVDRSGPEETLLAGDRMSVLWDWWPDGRSLVYGDYRDLWLLPLDGDRKPVVYLARPPKVLVEHAQFSPDSRWMAYASNEQGALEVFVQPVPATGALWQISTAGGSMPRWRGDGGELYYRAADGTLMAVATHASAVSFDHGTPQALFGDIPSRGNLPAFTYEAADDGRRFLVNLRSSEADPPITVVLNWQNAIGR